MGLTYKNKPEISEFIRKYQHIHPLLGEMRKTEQDHIWHQEGNVETHVSMVLSELYKLIDDEFSYINERDKQILMFAAVYHDYGKPVTTRTDFRGERECIVAPRHEQVGASRLLLSERPDELNHSEWMTVIRLISNHQMPKRAVSNEYSRGSMIRLLLDSDSLLLLHILSIADFKGRVAQDMERQLEYLELFLIEVEYLGLLEGSSEVVQKFRQELDSGSLIGGGTYKRDGGEDCDAIFEQIMTAMIKDRILSPAEGLSLPFNHSSKSKVFVMCGLSGAGKSHLTAAYAIKHQAEVISLDLIREEVCNSRSAQDKNGKVKHIAFERLRECLRKGKNVVWDATSLREDFRTAVTSLARGYGAYTKIICLTTPWPECVRRDAKRHNSVGEMVIHEQFEKFQMPTSKEADSILFI